MAEKKSASQAQKAAQGAKRKSSGSTSGKTAASGKSVAQAVVKSPEDTRVSRHIMWALISLGLFVVFLLMGINPDGALLKAFQPLLMGLFGKAAFYFAVPALLYLFVIFITGGRESVRMRCFSLMVFVLVCGCFFHLCINRMEFGDYTHLMTQLYKGGISGTTGGVICGLVAMLLRWLCGNILSIIILLAVGILTLLASMKITIPSVVRAIRNRPRDDWEDEDFEEERPEPAAVVVNHIANKRIEQKRQRRQQLEERSQMTVDDFVLLDESTPAKPEKKQNRVSDLMSQIGGDVEEPVTAAQSIALEAPPREQTFVREEKAVPTPVLVEPEEEFDEEPVGMPPLEEVRPAPEPVKVPVAAPVKEKVTAKDTAISAMEVAQEVAKAQSVQKPVYCFPPIDLLNRPSRDILDGTAEMRENSRRLNETLESFRIDAHIINVTRGPSVTRYEVELDKGVRLNKLTTVADDIALSLGAPSVRIAPVPNKISVVGIEVPNRAVTTVTLREVIDSPEFNKSKSKSSFSVGKDIGGSCIIGNIAKMPHMLIAGTTGSGKSVCMNSIIISLLYKASPEDVKLIMVDPKMVELANYNGIPHLMIPVVTDPKKAAGALQWAVTEMMRRYKTMSDAGVRDLESYNSIVMAEDGEKVPQLIVIIDELADLMLVAAKEVEDSICRIAQMGRAAGIHLVIATQRPSADVITGLMKANIPSRIAFSVASAMESRIILDTQGAEKLVGKGDMLFAPIGCGKPMRVQGCFVTDAEVEAVANYVKEHYTADYDQQVLKDIEKNAQQTGKKPATTSFEAEPNGEELEGDEMLPAAVDVILETGQASVSMLQRRLKLGYARAARIVDEMEEKGYVGPFQGSKPRTILITKEQWEAQKGGAAQMDFDDIPFDVDVPEEID